MISKKICMLGAFSVGKTSLVQQYVHSIFTDRYLSTIGVKISKKVITVQGHAVTVLLWDLEGKDDFVSVNMSYLRGAAGFLLVADGTRAETLDIALALRSSALALTGPVPHKLLVNKADLTPSWEVTMDQMQELEQLGVPISLTSAKTGLGVEETFRFLAESMVTG